VKTKKLNKIDILAYLTWMIFGIFGAINYYSRAEYLICGIMALIAILYAYRLIAKKRMESN
jgi:uncharacterized membrane protein YuzA (DUF378 family)